MQAQAIASQADKRQRQYDKTIDEWRQKCTDIQSELDNAMAESRASAADVYKMKAQIDEAHDTIEALRRENKNLSGYKWLSLSFCFLISRNSLIEG